MAQSSMLGAASIVQVNARSLQHQVLVSVLETAGLPYRPCSLHYGGLGIAPTRTKCSILESDAMHQSSSTAGMATQDLAKGCLGMLLMYMGSTLP
jgi:hypothetical protein